MDNIEFNSFMMSRIIVISFCLVALAAISTAKLEAGNRSDLIGSWHNGAGYHWEVEISL